MKEHTEKKSVLFIISSLYGGGAEKVCSILASALSEKYNVTVAYLVDTENQYPFSPGCELVRIPDCYCHRKYIGTFVRLVRRNRFVRKLKKSRHIDASVSFLIPASQVNVFSRQGERVITSERANPKKYLPEQFWRTRVMYALSDYVVFQSEMVRGYYGPIVRRHSGIIQNPVRIACRASETRSRRIVTMGRLAEQKNHALLIRSFAEFLKVCPGYTLSIYGEGDLRPALEDLIGSLGLTGSVILEGNVQNVHAAIADAEMFVLSSDYEGLSNALLECMAMGIACVSTACEGSIDVVRSGENGLLVDVGDQAGLTRAMIELAQHPETRKRFEEQTLQEAHLFSVEEILKKWEAILFP